MELKTNETLGKAAIDTETTRAKKIPKKIQTNKIENQRQDNNANSVGNDKPIIKNPRLDPFKKKMGLSANVIAARKENKPIETIGNEKFKDLLTKFDKNLKINTSNKENYNTQINNQKDIGINNIKIQERMQQYLETVKERTQLKTSTADPILEIIKGNSIEGQDEEENFSEKSENNDNIDDSNEELGFSMEHNDDSNSKEHDSNKKDEVFNKNVDNNKLKVNEDLQLNSKNDKSEDSQSKFN